ncbi:hypothetical protein [Bremerella alba]|uniref:Uncharacterized protein n=1 Tax=Bremerella alba TaxID=980252 RepID=A0A7V8V4U9_9BACT|nr:hypothetical protein [Bremerella alba]MBA2114988.1 hypothetical protein [Bremerella alba]
MHGLIKPTGNNTYRYLLHNLITLIFILTLSTASLHPLKQAQSAETPSPPNIVLIFIDDK